MSLFPDFATKPMRAEGKIGVIGGSGPEAGYDLGLKISKSNRNYMKTHGLHYEGDRSAVYTNVLSDPEVGGPHGEWDMVTEGPAKENLEAVLRRVANQLCDTTDIFACACNTLHGMDYVFYDVARERGCTFLSIVDCVERAIKQLSRSKTVGDASTSDSEHEELPGSPDAGPRVAVLGSILTTNQEIGPYKRMKTVQLDMATREHLQRIINQTKRDGPTDANKAEFKKLMKSIPADVFVLSCTEFPLLMSGSATVIDASACLAAGCVELAWQKNSD
jgi:aspartate racemase